MEFGCEHYQRRCSIRAPCCDEIFACRHCHNEAKNCVEIDPKERHEVPRHDVNQIICSQCGTEQDVQQNCSNCGVCFGKYFCEKCKLFDDDVSKRQFHCDGCGICRTGGEENFFHCDRCGCCYVNSLKGTHRCIEQAMHQNCPVCYEYMFDSLKDISVLSCGHTIHLDCLNEMRHHCRFSCPICSRSVCDMASVWRNLDQEIASTPMPEVYKNKMVWILCNDCGLRSNIHFHIVAHKCPGCNSYNTRQTQGGPEECLSGCKLCGYKEMGSTEGKALQLTTSLLVLALNRTFKPRWWDRCYLISGRRRYLHSIEESKLAPQVGSQ